MKQILLSIILTSFALISFAQVDRSKIPESGEPIPMELGKMESFQLKNGLKIYLLQTPNYPKFTMSINTQQPGFDEELQLEARSILSEAYTKKLSEKYYKGEIDSITQYVSGMLTTSMFNGTIKGMQRDVDLLLEMYSDLLFNPLIKKEYIKEEADNYQKKIARKKKAKSGKDKSLNITSYLLDSLINGKEKEKKKEDRILNYDTITISDIQKYRRKRMLANNTLVVVMGNFTVSECKSLMNKYFGKWKSGKFFVQKDKNISRRPSIKNRTIVVVDNPNAVQSKISFYWNIQDAFMHFDKEIELSVLNEVFGSSQLSYLYKNLREDKGLCYYIRSNIGPSGAGGSAWIGTSVKNDQTDLAIENIILEMIRIRNKEVGDHDLLIAKNSLIGEFNRSLSFISPMMYISFAMSKEMYNLPDDYLQTKVPKIYNVTKKDVLEMAKKYIDPFKCLIVVEGKMSDIKGTLEKFGSVSYVDKDGKIIEE